MKRKQTIEASRYAVLDRNWVTFSMLGELKQVESRFTTRNLRSTDLTINKTHETENAVQFKLYVDENDQEYLISTLHSKMVSFVFTNLKRVYQNLFFFS